MTRGRFAILLPVSLVLLTLGLWFWARVQYEDFMHRNSLASEASMRSFTAVRGVEPVEVNWPEAWTDYTPAGLQIAGALNAPVAMFTYPMYQLLHVGTSKWHLLVLLLGVALQWAYVGWAWDRRNQQMKSTPLLKIMASVGILFGVFVALVSIPMYHVSLQYKLAAVLWAVFICLHFLRFFRTQNLATT